MCTKKDRIRILLGSVVNDGPVLQNPVGSLIRALSLYISCNIKTTVWDPQSSHICRALSLYTLEYQNYSVGSLEQLQSTQPLQYTLEYQKLQCGIPRAVIQSTQPLYTLQYQNYSVGYLEQLYRALRLYTPWSIKTTVWESQSTQPLYTLQGWEFAHRFSQRIAQVLYQK